MAPEPREGIVHHRYDGTVDQAVAAIEGFLAGKGITLFAVVDHGGDGARAGFAIRPTKLLIFGNPKAGTPLMLAERSVGLDLPLKVLAWEDDAGATWLTHNTPAYLQARYALSSGFLPVLGAVEAVVRAVTAEPPGAE